MSPFSPARLRSAPDQDHGYGRAVLTFPVRPVAGRWRSGAWLPLAMLAGCALAGCGSAREDAAAEAAGRFVAAVGSSDAEQACQLLSPDTVRLVESLRPEGCQQVLPTIGLPAGPVTGVRVWGDAAQARTAGDVIFLRELAGGWRVVAAGCRPQGADLPYECEVGAP